MPGSTSTRPTYPTPYQDVNAVLDTLLKDVRAALGEHFAGMYLYGSLASGDFDPERSDIDFIVVTTEELPPEMISALEAMHARMAASGQRWAAKLEGAYMPRQRLRRFEPHAAPCPFFNEGSFYLARPDRSWVINLHVLLESGVVIEGPAPQTLVDPVEPDDIRGAVLWLLHGWWAPMLQDPARLRDGEYQAYAVLTMCRALYTLRHGTLASKHASARWARRAVGERWAGLIEWALSWKHDDKSDYADETLAFIRHTIEASERPETAAGGA